MPVSLPLIPSHPGTLAPSDRGPNRSLSKYFGGGPRPPRRRSARSRGSWQIDRNTAHCAQGLYTFSQVLVLHAAAVSMPRRRLLLYKVRRLKNECQGKKLQTWGKLQESTRPFTPPYSICRPYGNLICNFQVVILFFIYSSRSSSSYRSNCYFIVLSGPDPKNKKVQNKNYFHLHNLSFEIYQ